MKNRDMFLIDFTKKINSLENSEQLLELFGYCKICHFMGGACTWLAECPKRKALVEWLDSEVQHD